jgi:hypothetical protein
VNVLFKIIKDWPWIVEADIEEALCFSLEGPPLLFLLDSLSLGRRKEKRRKTKISWAFLAFPCVTATIMKL